MFAFLTLFVVLVSAIPTAAPTALTVLWTQYQTNLTPTGGVPCASVYSASVSMSGNGLYFAMGAAANGASCNQYGAVFI